MVSHQMAMNEEHKIANEARPGSPTLSQMLLNPKPARTPFRYPARRTPSENEEGTPKNFSAVGMLHGTPVSAPIYGRTQSGGTKSLGIRRRLRSVENTASPCLKRKRAVSIAAELCDVNTEKSKKGQSSFPVVQEERCTIVKCKNEDLNARADCQDTSLKTDASKSLHCLSVASSNPASILKHCQNQILIVPLEATNRSDLPVNPENVEKNGTEIASKKPSNTSKNLLSVMEKNLERHDGKSPAEAVTNNEPQNVKGNDVAIASNENILLAQKFPEEAINSLEEVDSDGMKEKKCTNHGMSNVTSKAFKLFQKTSSNREIYTVEKCDLLDESFEKTKLLNCNGTQNNCEIYAASTSPVLQRRKRRKKHRKCKADALKNHSTDSETQSCIVEQKPSKEDPAEDSSFLNDGFDMELLAIDLNEKFKSECSDFDQNNRKPSCHSQTDGPDTTCDVLATDYRHKIKSQPIPGNESDGDHKNSTMSSSYPLRRCNSNSSSLLSTCPRQGTNSKKCPDEKSLCLQIHTHDSSQYPAESDGATSDDELLAQAGAEFDKGHEDVVKRNNEDLKFAMASQTSMSDKALRRAKELLEFFGEESNHRASKDFKDQSNAKKHDKIASEIKWCAHDKIRHSASSEPADVSDRKIPQGSTHSTEMDMQDGFVGKAAEMSKALPSKDTETDKKSPQPDNRLLDPANEKCLKTIACNATMEFVGFQIASNKPVLVSDAALTRAKHFLSEDSKKIAAVTEYVKKNTPSKEKKNDQ